MGGGIRRGLATHRKAQDGDKIAEKSPFCVLFVARLCKGGAGTGLVRGASQHQAGGLD